MSRILARVLGLCGLLSLPAISWPACCYFSAKNADILQPAQKAFLTWDPDEKMETFTVQPKFEGNALDFGMVIPTPTQPKLHEMPRDFFKHLAVYTILKARQFPESKLLPVAIGAGVNRNAALVGQISLLKSDREVTKTEKPAIRILEAGL